MKNYAFKYVAVLTVLVGLLAGPSYAGLAQEVEITEVAWAGTEASWADEWIELKNRGEEEVDLSGWRISWEGTTILLGEEAEDTVKLGEPVLKPGDAFLLERSDDETVATIQADAIYKGSLANSGERMALMDDEGDEVQVIDANDGWPAGTGAEGEPAYAAMELRDGEWVTVESRSGHEDADGNEIYGSPGVEAGEEE